MKDKIKMLKKIISELEEMKDYPSDSYDNGVNAGINMCVSHLKEKISKLESI